MGKDTIADIITSIRNADMNRKGTVRIASTNITENIVKILLREGFIENARKHQERNKYFLVLTLRHRSNRKGPTKLSSFNFCIFFYITSNIIAPRVTTSQLKKIAIGLISNDFISKYTL